MSSAVVDASLALKWVKSEPYTAEARDQLEQWVKNGVTRRVPPLFPYEIANVLHRKARHGSATQAELERAFDSILGLVSITPLQPGLIKRAMALAAELHQAASYDVQYVALAEIAGCELWTADERFWNAVRARFPFVRWIGAR